MSNAISLVEDFELVLPCLFPTMITITPQAPLYLMYNCVQKVLKKLKNDANINIQCTQFHASPAFAGPSGIRARWGIDQWQI